MQKLPRLNIDWNDDIDVYMTKVESVDSVLEAFFRIEKWDFIRKIFSSVLLEDTVEYEDKKIVFTDDSVYLHVDEQSTSMQTLECLKVFFHLFDLMIVGANEDHHAIRYEPWWQEFTEVNYQLKYKIEVQAQLYEEVDIEC